MCVRMTSKFCVRINVRFWSYFNVLNFVDIQVREYDYKWDQSDLCAVEVVQVLDVGCVVATFSTYLLPLDIQTMSFAPKDGNEKQIQFALRARIWCNDLCFSHKTAAIPQ